MKRRLFYVIFTTIVLLVGCNDSVSYNDNEIALIVRGEEITIGDLRFLYPDDQMEENLDSVIKERLVKQEVQDMELDISEEVQATMEELDSYSLSELDQLTGNQMEDFISNQAKKLDMDKEEYLRSYLKNSVETAAYMQAYAFEILGEPTADNIEEFNQKANEHLDKLIEEHKDEIEILFHTTNK